MRRRSTAGWNIDNVVLDFSGGALSLAQLLLDAGCSSDWSAVSGDPVKFGLGFASMFFDTIFMAQHWICYRASRHGVQTSATRDGEMLSGGVGALFAGTEQDEQGGRRAPLLLNGR